MPEPGTRSTTRARWAGLAAAGTASALLLWTSLLAAYRLDRPDALAVASLTVLLTIPPLATYYLAMELSRRRSLSVQIGATYAVALLWLTAQRSAIYPLLGFRVSIGESVANLILLPTFGIATWLAVRSFSDRRRLSQALELQAETELKFLGAQLAPHTLFNMLNAVYAILLTDRDKAVPLFLAMSDALRHVVDRTREPWIALHEEMRFIENYAALERARNPDGVEIVISADGDLDAPIPPMLMATLFENAVTHGRFADGTLNIDVSVLSTDAEIVFNISNDFPPQRTNGTGIGLANVRNRLHLLYPERGILTANAEGSRHVATIRIAL